VFGVDIIDHDGKMAVAVAKRIGLVAIEIDGQFDLEGRGGMTQIDQREIRKLEMIGNFKAEGARVEIQRFSPRRTRGPSSERVLPFSSAP